MCFFSFFLSPSLFLVFLSFLLSPRPNIVWISPKSFSSLYFPQSTSSKIEQNPLNWVLMEMNDGLPLINGDDQDSSGDGWGVTPIEVWTERGPWHGYMLGWLWLEMVVAWVSWWFMDTKLVVPGLSWPEWRFRFWKFGWFYNATTLNWQRGFGNEASSS